jgi:hypothetical protein
VEGFFAASDECRSNDELRSVVERRMRKGQFERKRGGRGGGCVFVCVYVCVEEGEVGGKRVNGFARPIHQKDRMGFAGMDMAMLKKKALGCKRL